MKEVNDKIYTFISNGELEIERLMKHYNNYISAIINNSHIRLLPEDRDEIISDVYVVLWNNQAKLEINKSMSAYIAGITRNLIFKKGKKTNTLENIEDYEEQLIELGNFEIEVWENEQNQAIIKALDKMKVEDREIFIMYYYDMSKIKEIAYKYKMSEERVKSKLFRVRKKMKKILEEGGYSINER